MNVRHRVELSQIERDELTAMLGGGMHDARKLKRAQILLRPIPVAATRRSSEPSGSAFPASAGRSAASWKAIWSGP